jgi:hypothetical protein
MIHKDAATNVLLICTFLSVGIEQTAQWLAVEVVHRDFLPREQIVPLKGSLFLFDHHLYCARRHLASLLSILAGCAERAVGELTSSGV